MLTELLANLSLPPLVYVVLVLALTLAVTSWLQTPGNLPPCPVRPYPILGHLPVWAKQPRETMMEWRQKTGDIFSIYMGKRLAIVINSYELMKETLVKQADIFSDRPYVFLNEVVPDGDLGIVGASGLHWKEQRTVSLSILRSFGMGKNFLAEKIKEEVQSYLDKLASFKGEPRDVRILTNTSVSNVICNIIVGQRFEHDDPFFVRFMEIFNEQLILSTNVSLSTAFPWLRFLPGDFFNCKKLIQNNEDMECHFVKPFVKKNSENIDENNVDNFIAAYVLEMRKKEKNGESTTMDMAALGRVINNLFIAGTETTSTTIMWFMVFMLRHPDIQQKVFKEINDVVGTERAPNIHDKPKLNYLNATIMETLRRASIVPFNLPHLCSAEVKVQGYTIPAGTLIIPNLDAVLLDEKIWGDPMNFRPERFLDDERNLLQPEEFIPFSLGRRACLGESLARMELFLFLSALMQKFKLEPAKPKTPPSLDCLFGTACAPKNFEIRFVDRRD